MNLAKESLILNFPSVIWVLNVQHRGISISFCTHWGLSRTEQHPLQNTIKHLFIPIFFHLRNITLLVRQEFELMLGRIISKRLRPCFSLILKFAQKYFQKYFLKQTMQMITHKVPPSSLKKIENKSVTYSSISSLYDTITVLIVTDILFLPAAEESSFQRLLEEFNPNRSCHQTSLFHGLLFLLCLTL